ncbi:MAG TPA: type II toxin-antitoxin system RelE/ParE family toxin [Candidatus Sumerlaeota bacterium]|nr:type II toxin-antitoxin system RelE/ParE family toxin [Candidatus Sumerlaeota bacterium]HPS03446.1 type II toxin-antitoxin system RelE/ParE family toxin [Candidatus Sumerlaeota bacterium]
MEILFHTRQLEKQYREYKEVEKSYGRQVARKYIERINIIKQTRDIAELQRLPSLRCHPLKGNREGQWAVNLTGFWRLIFTLQGDCLQIVQIEEVSKHYDD